MLTDKVEGDMTTGKMRAGSGGVGSHQEICGRIPSSFWESIAGGAVHFFSDSYHIDNLMTIDCLLFRLYDFSGIRIHNIS